MTFPLHGRTPIYRNNDGMGNMPLTSHRYPSRSISLASNLFLDENIMFKIELYSLPNEKQTIYFHSSPNSILILRAGKKATQNSDIDLAISYKRDWQRRSVHEQ